MGNNINGVRERLERACIDEHGITWLTAEVYGADLRALLADHARLQALADPWRGLYASERMPKLDGHTYEAWHPDLPSWPDDREDSIAPLLAAQGFEWKVVEGDYGDEWGSLDFDPAGWLTKWEPESPGPEWRITLIHDTEDGPAAVFVRPASKAVQP